MLKRDMLRASRMTSTSITTTTTTTGGAPSVPRTRQPSRPSRPPPHHTSREVPQLARQGSMEEVPAMLSVSTSSLQNVLSSRERRSSSASSRPSVSSTSPMAPGSLSPAGQAGGDESVCVAVRCRPPNVALGEPEDDIIVGINPTQKLVTVRNAEAGPWYVDAPVWSGNGPAADGSGPVSQSALYEQIGRPLLLHALEGYNSTLMAYGPTGSGKTYTMIGELGRSPFGSPSSLPGVGPGRRNDSFRSNNSNGGAVETRWGLIPRLCRDLFTELKARSQPSVAGEAVSWEVHVRYVEVYCEKISDLLNGGAAVSVREEVTPQTATFALVGARRLHAESAEDLLQALALGNRCRRTAMTKSNERSSRSHAIFVIELTQNVSVVTFDGTIATAPSTHLTIRLVDLAGSERVSETGVQGQQLKEAKDINLSLFTLGLVIECLTDRKRRNIKPPYRESVLTKLLRDAFGGNSKTTMICTVSPGSAYRHQTIQTLQYATKARRVRNRPRVLEDPSALELRRANEELRLLRDELAHTQQSSERYTDLASQLAEAKARLLREQDEAKERRAAMEQREGELAQRLRELEEQRENYETQMAALEAEAELAKQRQGEREAELRQAHRDAEATAQRRLQQLQEQWAETESALHAKEADLLKQQRAAEAQLREQEIQTRNRVDDMTRRQRELEAQIAATERSAAAQERELQAKYALAEQQARELEAQSAAMTREWTRKVEQLEGEVSRREAELQQRGQEARELLLRAEEEARSREEAMRRKWADAEAQARELRLTVEAQQSELDRRVLQLSREAQAREGELGAKLQAAEFELRQRERESAQHEAEAAALRQTVARQSASQAQAQGAFEDALREREANLRRREAELETQFADVLAKQRAWEEQHTAKAAELLATRDEALAQIRALQMQHEQQESAARQRADELRAALHDREMELQRREVEFMARCNELDARARRDQSENLKLREELQHELARLEAEDKLREERQLRAEEDLRARQARFETAAEEQAAALAAREAAVNAAEDQIAAQTATLAQQQRALELNEIEYERRAAEVETERRRLQQEREQQEKKETPLAVRSQQQQRTSEVQLAAAAMLLQREQYDLFSLERLYRGVIMQDEENHFLLLRRSVRVGLREVEQQRNLRQMQSITNAHRRECERALEAQRAAEAQSAEWRTQVGDLRQALAQQQRLTMEVKVLLGDATSTAQFAEDSLRRLRHEADLAAARYAQQMQSKQDELSHVRDQCARLVQSGSQLALLLQTVVAEFEQRERSVLEEHAGYEHVLLRRLQMEDGASLEKATTIRKWELLFRQHEPQLLLQQQRSRPQQHGAATGEYKERSARGGGVAAAHVDDANTNWADGSDFAVEDARRLLQITDRERELRLREEGFVQEVSQLQQRIARFESAQRVGEDRLARQQAKVKRYLLELEALDRKKLAEFHEREEQLVRLAVRLREKDSIRSTTLREAFSSLLLHRAEQQSQIVMEQEALQRESIERIQQMTLERNSYERSMEGDPDQRAEHLQMLESHIAAERAKLQQRIEQATRDEDDRKRRLAAEDERIRRYLIALEAEDAMRAELSEHGKVVLQEAENRLAKAKQREDALRDMARRLHLEAATVEDHSRDVEAALHRQERSMRKHAQRRQDDLRRRKEEVSALVDKSERTLVALEADLRTIINKNRDAEDAIRARDAELKRQKLYYVDLSKLLKERERMLLLEHAHRMDGKHSATWLTGDLLDVNDQLKHYIEMLARKFHVLRTEDKVECELCSWLNSKEASVCRCCGNKSLVQVVT